MFKHSTHDDTPLLEYIDQLNKDLGQAESLAAIALHHDFSTCIQEIQINYWSTLLNILQHAKAACQQMTEQYKQSSTTHHRSQATP